MTLRTVVGATGRGEILADGTCLVFVPVFVPVGCCDLPGSIFLIGLIGLAGRAVVVATISFSDSSSSAGLMVGCACLGVVTGLTVGCGLVLVPPLTPVGCLGCCGCGRGPGAGVFLGKDGAGLLTTGLLTMSFSLSSV